MGAEIGHVLGEISEDEVQAGRPMLSAVAVGVSGRPGAGFFEWAKHLGRFSDGEDAGALWQKERNAVHAAWQRGRPKA